MKIFAALFLVVVACSAYGKPRPNKVTDTLDPYNGNHLISLAGVDTGVCHRGNSPNIGPLHLDLFFVRSKDGQDTYSISVVRPSDDLLRVPVGGTMDILIDGTPISIKSDEGSTVTRNRGTDVASQLLVGSQLIYLETVRFQISRNDLELMSEARKVQFRVNGAESIERCINEKHLAELQVFLDSIPPAPEKP